MLINTKAAACVLKGQWVHVLRKQQPNLESPLQFFRWLVRKQGHSYAPLHKSEISSKQRSLQLCQKTTYIIIKSIQFIHFHSISTIIFHALFIKVLCKSATQTSVRSSGWFWNSVREFLNHCHTFPKHYRHITIIFSSRSKTPGAQGFTLSFQELTMSRASAKSWKGERLPGLWLCKDKDPGPSGGSIYWQPQERGWAPSGRKERSTLLLPVSAQKK